MNTQTEICQDEPQPALETVEESESMESSTVYRRRSAHRLPGEEDDEALMTRIATGDSRALEKLFDRHAGLIKSVIFKIIHNDSEAEDVLMEVFFEAWNHATKFSSEKGKALGWLVTMARRRGIVIPDGQIHSFTAVFQSDDYLTGLAVLHRVVHGFLHDAKQVGPHRSIPPA
jgi:hypothetical protein